MTKDARQLVALECPECKSRGYHTDKRMKGQDVIKRIELSKYCGSCQKRTVHKESK